MQNHSPQIELIEDFFAESATPFAPVSTGSNANAKINWVNKMSEKEIMGIPKDIALVLAIDVILIGLRLSGALKSNAFIGAKAMGTSALIGLHFL